MEFNGYDVIRRLALGGMCEVFLVRARNAAPSDPPRALKSIHRHLRSEEKIGQMFRHEASLLRHLDHPTVPRLVDYRESPESWFLVMEFADGLPLSAWTAARRAVSVGDVVTIASALLDGLSHVHTRRDATGRWLSIVHRDITPGNIVITLDGGLKIIDFGIATSIDLDAGDDGASRGTSGYIAPEILDGSRHVDGRADLFCLGVLAYELLVGARLFGGDRLQAMRATMESDIVRPSEAAGDRSLAPLDDVIIRALHRDPNARWGSAAEMRGALVAAASHIGVQRDVARLARLARASVRPPPPEN